MSGIVIVARHKGALDYIRSHAADVADLAGCHVYDVMGALESPISSAMPEDVMDTVAVGVIPYALAALARRVVVIEFPAGHAPRGRELSAEEMEDAGARLVAYRVTRLRRNGHEKS